MALASSIEEHRPDPKVPEAPKRGSALNTEGLAPQLNPNDKGAAEEERIEPASFLALFRCDQCEGVHK